MKLDTAIILICFTSAFAIAVWTYFYINQKPIVIMIEDNQYRDADYVCIPNGFACEGEN